ncbi:hypothetical protein BOX15_Mlig005335g2 [Macrostomum lignano]|uniref:BSD domain-containing protein n=1 Tax=Macrostomum lignano TaxID=282301 RepID=A0A267E526_9PLAT|nr:hypothetical protein BOX15_Mlig005335g5 [Macrostomum lignano]PAA46425.1 hypothetical protein BOX15_Mlig005335g4 [Macrostomum lignano]PAA55762.1 hypothetical protein BOX15_Mlig005335g2 [Macrostomum lignano]
MSGGGEEILLSTEHVRYKTTQGTLYLMATRVGWSSQRSDLLKLTVAYQDVKAQLVSPMKKEKVQLQLELHSGVKETFLFSNPAGHEQQLKDRDAVKELLMQLLPRFRQHLFAEFEGKTSLLERNPELLQLYKDLVPTGIVGADEFWSTYQHLAEPRQQQKPPQPAPASSSASSASAAQTSQQQQQRAGVSADFLSAIKPVSQDGGFKYSLTADIIQAIFATYPAVRRKHAQLVPQAVSEQEFWLRFFQSHYFHRDRLHVARDEVFADCAAEDEAAFRRVMERITPDVFVDLTRLADADTYRDEEAPSSVGGGAAATGASAGGGSSSTTGGQQLIRRCNQHSLMVLQSEPDTSGSAAAATNGTNGDAAAAASSAAGADRDGDNDDGQLASKRRKLRELTRFDDLGDVGADEAEAEMAAADAMALERIERYLFGPAAQSGGDEGSSGSGAPVGDLPSRLPDAQLSRAVARSLNHLDSWPNLRLSSACTAEEAVEALRDLSVGGRLSGVVPGSRRARQEAQQQASGAHIEEIRALARTLAELLRHFWACFPVTSAALEAKLTRVRAALTKLDSDRIQPLAQRRPEAVSQLRSLLSTAFAKHDQWLSKKQPKR